MDFNRLNKLEPLVKSKIKKEVTRLFLVEEKKKKSKIIPLNARGQCDIKCAGWISLLCSKSGMPAHENAGRKLKEGGHFIACCSVNSPDPKESSECSISEPLCYMEVLFLLNENFWTKWRSRAYYYQPKSISSALRGAWRSRCIKVKWSHCRTRSAVLEASCYSCLGHWC